jgi:endonuclease/exonuclease/phosphatase family metal-dependent hydrolase
MISALSYNIHFGKKLDAVLGWLVQQTPPDIICFQEFPKHRIAACVRALSGPDYGYRFAPSLGNKKNRSYGVLTLFRKATLLPVSFRRVSLGINILERAWFGSSVARHSLVTVFRYKTEEFVLANTHLVCSAPNSHKYRQIATIFRALRSYPRPVVIVGDYNIPGVTGKRNLIRFMKKNGYRTDEKRISTFRIAGMHTQVDYVFWRNCTVRSVRSLRVRHSDHYPVRFTISSNSASRLHVARHTRMSAAP